MEGEDTQRLDEDLQRFRRRVVKMASESTKQAHRRAMRKELPLEVPFHEGEAGAYEIVLSALNDVFAKKSSASLNAVEEVYLGLLLDYKRMRGSAEALETVLTEMQNLFALPSEKEVEQNERLVRRIAE